MKGLFTVLFAATMAAIASAGDYMVATDAFNYSGTVARYATLADAQGATNMISSATLSQPRDGAIWHTKNAPTSYAGAGYENDTILATAWYYTIDPGHGPYSGWGNPNNTDDSFMQLYNSGNGTVTSNTASWNGSFTALNVSISGVNADYTNSYARLWSGQSGSSLDDGVFLSYSINYTLSGLSATLDPSTGWMKDDTSRGVMSGTFTGIFENREANAGFYVYSVNLFDSGTTYGEANSANLNGAFFTTFVAAPVPEPASLAIMSVGLLALKRRKKA